jgi:hypothetical protein
MSIIMYIVSVSKYLNTCHLVSRVTNSSGGSSDYDCTIHKIVFNVYSFLKKYMSD